MRRLTRDLRRTIIRLSFVTVLAATAGLSLVVSSVAATPNTTQTPPNVSQAASDSGTLTAQLITAKQNLARAYIQRQQAIERYNQAVIDAERAGHTAIAAHQETTRIENSLAEAHANLDSLARRAYQGYGSVNLINAVLSADNVGDFLHAASVATEMGDYRSQLIVDLSLRQSKQKQAASAAQKALVQRTKALSDAAAAKQAAQETISRSLAERDALSARLNQIQAQLALARKQAGLPPAAGSATEPEADSSPDSAEIPEPVVPSNPPRKPTTPKATPPKTTAPSPSTPSPSSSTPSSGSPSPADQPSSSVNSASGIAVTAALSQLGKPYVWAGENPAVGFDCSGLVTWAYRQAGIRLPHFADYQWDAGRQVSRGNLMPGDLVFWADNPTGPRSGIYHVAIWIGNGKIVEAADFGIPVRTRTMYWRNYYGAVRIG